MGDYDEDGERSAFFPLVSVGRRRGDAATRSPGRTCPFLNRVVSAKLAVALDAKHFTL